MDEMEIDSFHHSSLGVVGLFLTGIDMFCHHVRATCGLPLAFVCFQRAVELPNAENVVSPLLSSPKTRGRISTKLVPNLSMKSTVEKLRDLASEHARRAEKVAVTRLEVAESDHSVQCLSKLSATFTLLDGLRDLLYETLEGWQPPNIVVVGEESSGKSSVLERLIMMPILPRNNSTDESVCTRLPIHLRLRHCDAGLRPAIPVS